MARSKSYKANVSPATGGLSLLDACESALIELPPNPRSYRVLDLSPWLGRGFDDWVCAFVNVIRALLGSGNYSVATIVSFDANGVRYFMRFLIDVQPSKPLTKPSALRRTDIDRYVAWLKLKYPNGATAKNHYSATKSLLGALIHYGFIDEKPEALFPSNPFSMNGTVMKAEEPLSSSEMQRLATALKDDLAAIHHNRFQGNDSEAMTVLLLLVAMRTGINATPLIEMTRDCLRPHPFMPNMMLIQTFKRRGKGAQSHSIRQTQVHDTQNSIPMDGVAVLKKALKITESLTELAPDAIRKRIWLYRSSQYGKANYITALTSGTSAEAVRSIVMRHALTADVGSPLRVTTGRLRKTMENRLWRLSDGDLMAVASVMGHSPRVADNHYLRLDERTKVEGAKFIGEAFPAKLRGESPTQTVIPVQAVDLTPTPTGSCKDSLHGALAPGDGATHCEQFTHCLGCASYAIVGTVKDLHRLFSYQAFLLGELSYYSSDEWSEWRDHHRSLITLIDQFTSEHFPTTVVQQAKTLAQDRPHPFWQMRSQQSRAGIGGRHDS